MHAHPAHGRSPRIANCRAQTPSTSGRAELKGTLGYVKKLVGRIPVAKLLPGGKVRLAYPPFDVLVVHAEGAPYAIEDACNHAGASLMEGRLRGCEVTCPMHGYVFDVRTGALLMPRGLCADQRVFEIVREGDDWVVYDPVEQPFAKAGLDHG